MSLLLLALPALFSACLCRLGWAATLAAGFIKCWGKSKKNSVVGNPALPGHWHGITWIHLGTGDWREKRGGHLLDLDVEVADQWQLLPKMGFVQPQGSKLFVEDDTLLLPQWQLCWCHEIDFYDTGWGQNNLIFISGAEKHISVLCWGHWTYIAHYGWNKWSSLVQCSIMDC